MTTAKEDGVMAITNPSPYGGGGAGGKFRRKTFRRQPTPYDRPPNLLRGNDHNPGGWLTKIFVDPARKLISRGVDRFFASVFRKRLQAPLSTRQPEMTNHISDTTKRSVINDEEAPEDPVGDGCINLDGSSTGSRISDLEQVLKQNTFSRPEIVRLTELLQSKAADVSSEKVEAIFDFGQNEHFSAPLGVNRKEELQFSASMSTPVHQLKVPEDDVASPAELAKAYMRARASNGSPVLGVSHSNSRNVMEFPINGSASKSLAMPSNKTNLNSFSTVENGLTTPNFGGRSSMHRMAHTPYSRDHSILKANTMRHGRLPLSFSTTSVGNGEKYGSRSVGLKRRISALDDEIVSIGPVRRIRQKSNLLASRISLGGGGIRSHTKEKLGSMGEPSNKDPINCVENGNSNTPSTNYAHVPSQSSEVAAKILQELEKLSPTEKSSDFKSHVGLEKSKFQLTASMLSKKALRSMESLDSPKFPQEIQYNEKLEEMACKSLPDSDDSLKKLESNEGNVPNESLFCLQTQNSDGKIDLSLNSKKFLLQTKTADSCAENGASEPSRKKRAFRISAQEDFLELDDDVPGPVEKSELVNLSTTVSKVFPSKETNLVKTEIRPETALPSCLNSRKAEFSFPSVSNTNGKGSVTLNSGPTDSLHSEASQLPVGIFKEPNATTEAFISSSNVDDTFPSLSSHSQKEAALKLDSTNSLAATFPFPSSRENELKEEKKIHLDSANAGETNGKSGTILVSANKPLFSGPPSFHAPCSGDLSENSTGSGFLISSSASATNNVSNASTANGESIFGIAAKSSSSAGHPPFAISADKTTFQTPDYSSKAEILQSSGGLSESRTVLPAIGDAKSGISTSGFGSNFGQSTNTDFKSPIFGDPFKNLVSGAGTIASASTSDTKAVVPGGSQETLAAEADRTDATIKAKEVSFGLNSSLNSANGPGTSGTTQNFIFSSSTGSGTDAGKATPSFSFGISSSSAETNGAGTGGTTQSLNFSSSTVTGLDNDKAKPSFSFAAGSSSFAGVTSAGSFTNDSSSIFSGFGWSSAASAINSLSSSSASSNAFGQSLQNSNSPVFGTKFTSFGASSTPSAPITSAASVFSSTTTAPSNPLFSFTTTPASMPSSSFSQPVFGKSLGASGFSSSPTSNDKMNAEDSMAEDPVHTSAPAFPVFGQQPVQTSAPGFPVFGQQQAAPVSPFGSTQANPFLSFGQQNQVNQGSGSVDFNASGGGFSMGSAGPDKSRRTVRVSKVRNRKKP